MQKILRLSSIIDQLFHQSNSIASVKIAVGELSDFSEDEIQTQWSLLVENTKLSKTKHIIQQIPAKQQCMVCFQKYSPLNKKISCPYCGSVGAKILAGEEFYLQSFEE